MRLMYQLFLFVGMVFFMSSSAMGQYSKLLVVGNSLTQHGRADYLEWYNECGMAASSLENDFAHQLQSMLQASQPDVVLSLTTAHIADERNSMTGTGAGSWTSTGEALANTNADIIVFELGDNYKGTLDWANYGLNYVNTIHEIVAGAVGSPKILVTSNWYADATRDALNQQVVATVGATFVSLTYISNDPSNWGMNEDYAQPAWATNGVGSHPGDKGMAMIAEGLYQNITPEPATMSLLAIAGLIALCRRKHK